MSGCDQPGCGQPGLMPLAQARQQLLAQAECRAARERCSLSAATDRILASDIYAQVDVPPADNSAMDGYAVRLSDLAPNAETRLPVSQRIPAGAAPLPLAAASVARIFTGAEIPAGADAVVMQEQVRVEGGQVVIPADVRAQQNIRPRGQDLAVGTLVLAAGARLTPVALGVLASIGVAEVEVYKPLRVAILATGDELVEPGAPLAAGQIYNSNAYLIRGLLQSLGMQVVELGVIADTAQATESALRQAADTADLILTTGGVSVGEEDHVKAAIEKLGRIDLWKVNLKPGKPFAAGWVAEVPLYALPGNPGSALITFALLAQPCLLKAQGMTVSEPFSLPVRAAFSRARVQSRDEYLRASCSSDGYATPWGNQSSGMLSSLLNTNGLLRVPAGTVVEQGQVLEFFPLAMLLRP
ncbi:molybdopterin molybdotransferase MoeA [Marinobacterium sp. D7]|uniref:molybdopterin molybdotransferase MoeA n=1 Tax=Marinobacterium ramblicola TaxID=2849041 RepID=UPI001C2DC4F2|nr:gephyrin-like molybdotransferase Glp [Marinobacterium ramblicola]MBV1790313.1 molybdopterin molybdotransferase MoeA [Marinobacterium ramblicola]